VRFAIDHWNSLLAGTDTSAMCGRLSAQMRERRLRFGDRVVCPFLRPFFLDAADEARVRGVAEMLWRLGERVAAEAIGTPQMLADLALSDDEIRLAQIDPGYGTTSTAARADAFILPDSLQFAEYNAESPAGLGYSQLLAELFDGEQVMAAFRERFDVRFARPIEALLEALLASYREWGGTASPPRIAIVDWREVPTWAEFEILQAKFIQLGVPTIVCDPRDLRFEDNRLTADGQAIDLVYRRVLINDILSRADDCRALTEAYAARAVCVANTFRCKIPHKKAFFAILTDQRYAHLFERADLDAIHGHVPWTRMVDAGVADEVRRDRERFVLKPNDEYGGTGVTLGWETPPAAWDSALDRAVAEGGWIAQQRIRVRREPFPVCDGNSVVERDMLVDFAPYLFRGRVSGFLTRLSATGLANVTSGGGQVPAFVVHARQ
jgi:uncharacterized circularly permuted ATP-grasp superfamily protein